jgi:hypothetical protein
MASYKENATIYMALNQLLIEANDRLKGTNLYKREFKKHASWKDDVCQKHILDMYKRIGNDFETEETLNLVVSNLETFIKTIEAEGLTEFVNRLIFINALTTEQFNNIKRLTCAKHTTHL